MQLNQKERAAAKSCGRERVILGENTQTDRDGRWGHAAGREAAQWQGGPQAKPPEGRFQRAEPAAAMRSSAGPAARDRPPAGSSPIPPKQTAPGKRSGKGIIPGKNGFHP